MNLAAVCTAAGYIEDLPLFGPRQKYAFATNRSCSGLVRFLEIGKVPDTLMQERKTVFVAFLAFLSLFELADLLLE